MVAKPITVQSKADFCIFEEFESFVMKTLLSVLFFLIPISLICQLPMNWHVGTGGNPARNCLSTAYGPESANLLWDGSLYALRGYQTCIDGDVVLASRRFNYNNQLYGAHLVAHDLHSGDTLWTGQLPVLDPENESFSQVKGANNGQVYCTRADGIWKPSPLYALDIYSGDMLWQSDALMTTSFSEDVSFAPNGDVIIGNFHEIIRVDHLNGEILWSSNRSTPSSDGANVAVYSNRAYAWEASPSGPKISVFDLETGAYLYSSDAVSAGLIQQTGLMVGPDGTIYAPRTQNNPATDFFVSYTDTGSEFIKNWEVPYGYAIWASSAVGPDGTVYTYNTSGEVIGLNPADGSVLFSSEQIISSYPAGPKIAIGQDGILYVTNGEYGEEKLYSFDPDLTTRWSESIPANVIEGPSLAYDGTLVVCAGGTQMRVYEGNPVPQVFANFMADTLLGEPGLAVNFSDLSQALFTTISSWEWDLDNNGTIDATDQNPYYVYPDEGSYSVRLVVSDGNISDTLILEDYIHIQVTVGLATTRPELKVYPNPFRRELNIACQDIIDRILVYNMQGQLLLTPIETTRSQRIDLGVLPDGPYLLRIFCRGKAIDYRLIKKN